jgi:hypothetical protein
MRNPSKWAMLLPIFFISCIVTNEKADNSPGIPAAEQPGNIVSSDQSLGQWIIGEWVLTAIDINVDELIAQGRASGLSEKDLADGQEGLLEMKEEANAKMVGMMYTFDLNGVLKTVAKGKTIVNKYKVDESDSILTLINMEEGDEFMKSTDMELLRIDDLNMEFTMSAPYTDPKLKGDYLLMKMTMHLKRLSE